MKKMYFKYKTLKKPPPKRRFGHKLKESGGIITQYEKGAHQREYKVDYIVRVITATNKPTNKTTHLTLRSAIVLLVSALTPGMYSMKMVNVFSARSRKQP